MVLMGMIGVLAIKPTMAKAESWNQSETSKVEVEKDGFTYYVTPSTDGKKAWIHQIKISKQVKSGATLEIPEKINEMTVTKLGAGPNEENSDFQVTLFGTMIETYHEIDGSGPYVNKIKKMTIPNTVKSITYYAFSGMDGLEKAILPESLKSLRYQVFYDCDKLKEVYLPAGMKKFSLYAFEECDNIEKMIISKKNKKFSVRNGKLLSQDKKKLIWILPTKTKVTITKKVEKINPFVLSRKKLENVEVAKGNQTFAKDGQCIYKKKDGRLAAVIVKNNKVKISSKVKILPEGVSVVGKEIKRVDIPASVVKVIEDWMFFEDAKVYFHSKKTPVIVSDYEGWEFTALPIFNKVYVPKGAKKIYKQWAKDRDGLEWDYLYTF